MPKTKVEVYDKNQLIYPYIESDHVTFSNGMKVNEMLDQSISMPTVIHEDLNFKVGVGDQDVSSAIVDSSVSEMTIKGKTYQNILPEPSTHVLTNNKEMFKVNEGLDSNVEIVDGVSKSAILKGQTLVNLLNVKTVPGSKSNVLNMGLKSNTKYIFIADTMNDNKNQFNGKYVYNDGTMADDFALVKRADKGKVRNIFTTPNKGKEIVNMNVYYVDNINNSPMSVDNMVIIEYQEGMENWNIPYFEGMQSVKMPVLTTIGKNLWSGENITIGSYVNGQGALTAANTDFLSDFIEVKPNTTYAFKVMDSRATTPYGVKSLYDKNKKFISRGNGVHADNVPFTTPSNCHYVRIHGNSYTQCGNTIPDCMLIETTSNPSTIATHEPYKSNILSTPEEVVLRSLPNGAKDTLNLNTGEYVQRIGEITFNGSETGWDGSAANNNTFRIRCNVGYINNTTIHAICKEYESRDYQSSWDTGKFISVSLDKKITFRNDNIPQGDTASWKAYLQANPITVQYILETPIIKTVDLSSSGNWEKVVLDGSTTGFSKQTGGTNRTKTSLFVKSGGVTNARGDSTGDKGFNDSDLKYCNAWTMDEEGIQIENGRDLRLSLNKDKLPTDDENGLKQYLSKNPITIWYQTNTQKDTTQVKEPIFCKNGHIIQSSGAENSLIPTLDYQAKTSNSYVMDLMKTNTRYTMKAKSASGTFTIDGTSYGAGTNGTFTTPSSMANKFLVMSSKTNEEVMILEGDVADKTIPYFKGIKSAFEDEDKIEVLSTGRNLCPPQPEIEGYYVRYQNGTYVQHDSYNVSKPIRVIEGHRYRLINTNKHHAYYDKNMNYITTPLFSGSDADFYSIAPKNAVYLRVSMMKGLEVVVNTDGAKGEYREPNSTKIPLLSPLRSLPNGVCDEIILDREKNKVTLIQRVGHTILGQNDDWGTYDNVGDTMKVGRSILPHVKNRGEGMSTLIPYTFNSVSQPNEGIYIYRHASSSEVRVRLKLKRTGRHDAVGMQNWLRSNNIVTLYELETPIITEIDLEGFPYIYKDGHIFLNSKIIPTTEIVYSINQCQQISASNEDIIRHEKELTYLQKLIAQYVQVDYESALLSLKV